MRYWKAATPLLILALAIAGCAKKSNDQASITGTGFDAALTDDLTQLPQSTAVTAQQAGIETLPVETSPITQGVPPIAGPASAGMPTDLRGLSRDQQIQTALRNAGFYSGNIDGKIGPASKRAIEEFQRNNGLTADGKVGPKTWAALEPYLTGSVSAQSGVSLE